MEKTLNERMLEEQLSDNSQIVNCEQCEKCVFWDNGDVWSNKFTKSSCKVFAYPSMKPLGVIKNTESCPYRKE